MSTKCSLSIHHATYKRGISPTQQCYLFAVIVTVCVPLNLQPPLPRSCLALPSNAVASDTVQLLSGWVSLFVMRAQVPCSFKVVSYSDLPQDVWIKSPLLLQSNPVYKKIPVLLDNGKPVCESMIIVQYVDEAFPSPDGKDLLPKDPYDKAVARFWADFVDKKIFDNLIRLIRTTGEEERKAVTVELREYLNTLDEAFGTVPKEPPFFGGAIAGYVDVILSPLIVWDEAFENLCKFQFEFEKLPRLSGWLKAMRESPVAQILPEAQKVSEFMIALMIERRKRAAQAAEAASQVQT